MTGDDGTPAVSPVLRGRVAWVFGDDFDVDNIIGPQNLKSSDPEFLRTVCMKRYDEDFVDDVEQGDLLVAGRNFGYGHPHYPAMIIMRHLGIAAVVAESFAPGFWRGETYNGMPLITCPGITEAVDRWDTLEVHWKDGRVAIPDRGMELTAERPAQRTVEILEAGGTYQLLLEQYGEDRAPAAAPG